MDKLKDLLVAGAAFFGSLTAFLIVAGFVGFAVLLLAGVLVLAKYLPPLTRLPEPADAQKARPRQTKAAVKKSSKPKGD